MSLVAIRERRHWTLSGRICSKERSLSAESHLRAGRRWTQSWAQRRGGFIEGVEDFDTKLFHLSSREAQSMGPAVRLSLETAWRTFEDAGHGRNGEQDPWVERNVGVFVGAMYNHYHRVTHGSARVDRLFDSSYFPLANRVSHFFDLHGPSFAIDAACASSTVAIHMACRESSRGGVCDGPCWRCKLNVASQ